MVANPSCGGPASSGRGPDDRRPVVPDHLSSMTRLVGLYRRQFMAILAEEEWVARSGVRPQTYGVLSVVDRMGPVSQREVCDILGVHASDLVDLVDAAEGQGWIERRRDPVDRRRYQLTLTDEGERTLDRYREASARAEALVLEPLTETERKRLVDLVSKVVAGTGAPRRRS
jgi:DNA-binding MarR family transcriptional regulator